MKRFKYLWFLILTAVLCLAVSSSALTLEDGQTLTGGTYTAEGDDESTLELTGADTAEAVGVTVRKTAGKASSADAASFRGMNAAVRVSGNAVLTLKDAAVEATAENATGIFAYENGTVYVSDTVVNVSGGGAGGVQVAGGGTLIGENLTVTSASKAAIRSDRGGGTMILTGGTYTSNGKNGCPAIYSTADITVKNAQCVSSQSRAVIKERKNSVILENCTLSGNDQSTKEGSVRANVLIYQSASGDAKEGTGTISLTDCDMTCQSGAMFYVTNTDAVIQLTGTALHLSDEGTLLTVAAGRWGKDGKNGGRCELNAQHQALKGLIRVDGYSCLSLTLTDATLTGAVNPDGAQGEVSVTLDESSVWTLAADSYVSSFTGELSQVSANGYHLYLADGKQLL